MSIFSKCGTNQCGVGRIAAEATDEVVVDAPGGHGVERADGHVAGVSRPGAATAGLAEAQLDEGGAGKLGCRTEAAPLRVEAGAEARDDALQHGVGVDPCGGFRDRRAHGLGQAHLLADGADQGVGLREDLVPLADPRLPNACTTRRNDGMPWRSTGGK